MSNLEVEMFTSIKECIGKLFTFSQGRLDDLEVLDVGKEIDNRGIGIHVLPLGLCLAILTILAICAIRIGCWWTHFVIESVVMVSGIAFVVVLLVRKMKRAEIGWWGKDGIVTARKVLRGVARPVRSVG